VALGAANANRRAAVDVAGQLRCAGAAPCCSRVDLDRRLVAARGRVLSSAARARNPSDVSVSRSDPGGERFASEYEIADSFSRNTGAGLVVSARRRSLPVRMSRAPAYASAARLTAEKLSPAPGIPRGPRRRVPVCFSPTGAMRAATPARRSCIRPWAAPAAASPEHWFDMGPPERPAATPIALPLAVERACRARTVSRRSARWCAAGYRLATSVAVRDLGHLDVARSPSAAARSSQRPQAQAFAGLAIAALDSLPADATARRAPRCSKDVAPPHLQCARSRARRGAERTLARLTRRPLGEDAPAPDFPTRCRSCAQCG